MISIGAVHTYRQHRHSCIIDCGEPQVAITLITSHIVRVRLAPYGTFRPHRSWAVAPPDEHFEPIPYTVEETSDAIIIRPEAADEDAPLAIHVQRNPCRISFVDAAGQRFCADSGGMQWEDTDTQVACAKHIDSGEQFFGFGERTGPLNKTGYFFTNWTTDPGTKQGPTSDPLYIAIPVFCSVRPGLAYGFFLNNTWRSSFDMGDADPHTWRMQADNGEIDYYVFYGPTPKAVSKGIGHVLGTTPLPPRWAIGYHQSRWGYMSEARVREIASTFRNRDIPCDVIHLDINYMDGFRVFTWDLRNFPDPKVMLDDLRSQGFRVVTIIDPGVKIDPEYHVYRQGVEYTMFIHRASGEMFHGYVWPDDAVFSDFSRPDVREWWGELQKALVDQGVRGIWNDMNEPTVFDQPFSQPGKKTWRPIDLDAVQGPDDERSNHAELRNLYGLQMARASYEGLRRHMNGERPFVLTRSAFAGVQRWSACWMGDNSPVWEHLEMTMPQLVNMGLSGVPFVGVDIGGFSGNASPELFARWIQLGALLPFSRSHTVHFCRDQEPWAFGERVEAISRTYLQWRYRFLPYLYTLFWESAQHGTPVLRPLFYHFPNDTATYHLSDQVMLGPSIMAAPITRAGSEYRAVYLPAGEWYDWWTDERIQGPTHILAHAPLEKMPLYVRAGAILPNGPEIAFADEKPLSPLTLDLYPGDGDFTLYEDDGVSFAHEEGQYCTTSFRLCREEGGLRFEIGERHGQYTPPERQLVIRIHGISPERAAYAGGSYDEQQRIVTITLHDDGKAHELRI
jgi:alpha-glucosidase